MRSFVLALAMLPALPASALAAPPRPTATLNGTPSCPDNPAAHVARSGMGTFHKLNKLPPAETYAAVYRRGADGCMVPVFYSDRDAPPAGATRRR